MNTSDVLKYGHQTVLQTVEGLPYAEWDTPGVCGVWSVRQIIAHLASFEHLLVDVLHSLLDDEPTPTLEKFQQSIAAFSDAEVAARQDKIAAEIWAEYNDTYAQAAHLLSRVPVEARAVNGLLPWYGQGYSLDDFIVYTFYGHKREHCAQIMVFRDQLNGKEES